MLRYVARRLLALIPTLLGISLVAFLILHMIPGDPAELLAGETASRADIEHVRRRLGLDRPLHLQYAGFLRGALTLDFGESFATGISVREEIASRYPATMRLASAAMAVSIGVGVPAGIVAAARRYSLFDNASMLVALGGISMPGFWLGLMLIYLFSVYLRWLPAIGLASPRHYVMPAVTLAMYSMALIARMTRSSLLEVLRHEYVTVARAKGLAERAVLYRHALRNALIPVVTIAGLSFGFLLGGSVIIESVFAINGLGRLLVGSILTRDYPVVQASVLVLASNFVLVNLAVDLLYAYLDPRIHYG